MEIEIFDLWENIAMFLWVSRAYLFVSVARWILSLRLRLCVSIDRLDSSINTASVTALAVVLCPKR